MEIKGRISQIIKPKERQSYMVTQEQKEKYLLVIEKEEIPTKFFERIIFSFKNRKKELSWTVLLDTCEYKEGDIINIEVEPVINYTTLYKKVN